MGFGARPNVAQNGFSATVGHREREILHTALRRTNGNKSAAARSLGMKLSTFRDKLIKYNIS